MNMNIKRLLALLLSIVMVVGMLPTAALAEEFDALTVSDIVDTVEADSSTSDITESELLSEETEAARSALERAVSLLSDLLGADKIPADVRIRWFDGAYAAMLEGNDYQNRDAGFVFRAAPAQSSSGREILRISIAID